MKWYQKISLKGYVGIGALLILIQIITLYLQGHVPICECGFVLPWHGAINSAQDSQHLTDWYTFSHIVHGFIFYWFLRKITGKRWPIALYLMFAIGIEVGWEILENSPIIINRYRETASLMYFGDSILNSVSDVVAMVLGFVLAWKIPPWLSVVFIIILELFALYYIRDNLTLNVVMLAHPFEAIKQWQLGM